MLRIGDFRGDLRGVDLRDRSYQLDRRCRRGRRDDWREADRDRADREVDRDFLVAVTVTCFFCSQ
jgi:hypothetical protein